MNDKNLCYSCARGKVCRENPAFPCKECAGYVAEQKWISVKDRLPKCFEFVLLWEAIEGDCFIGCLDSNNEWFVARFDTEKFEFTYWMPLPEPPATVSTKSE